MVTCLSRLIYLLLTYVLISTILVVNSDAYSITDCTIGKESDATLKSVVVDNCPLSGAFCPLVLGTNASIKVDFVTKLPFETAKVKLYGKIGGLPLPFPLKPNEACGNYGLSCPVKVNQTESLQLHVPVQRTYPKLPVTIQLNLLDEKNRYIVCIEFPARIVDNRLRSIH